MWFPVAFVLAFTAVVPASAQITLNGKCCKTDINLSNPRLEPHFEGFCWKTDTFGNSGTTYQCDDYGWLMYRPGVEVGKSGITEGAQFQIKMTEGGKGYVHVILRCAPEENPGLKKSFIVADHTFYCTSTVYQTFAGLRSCKHPRISYRRAGSESNIKCIS